MKKKIAVFANTWNSDIVSTFLAGFERKLKKDEYDTFVFLAANSYGKSEISNLSELSIHSLPVFEEYSAAVVFSQGLNSNEARQQIYENCEKAGIPTFCVGDTHPGFYGMLINNEEAMKSMCEHLYNEHNVRKVVFLAGSKENDDSNARLEAVSSFMKEKGLPFGEKDVCYTDWEVRKAMEFILKNFTEKEDLPDAFICANDILAIAADMGVERLGYSCPGDVAVTGFDYVYSGRTYYPSIATINQRFDEMGEVCARSINTVLKGGSVPEVQWIKSSFEAGESCGCINPRHDDEQRKSFCHSIIGKEYDESNRSGVIYTIRSAFQESSRFSTLPQKLQKAIYNTTNEEVRSFYLMLDPSLERLAYEEPEVLPKYTYSEKMQVVLAKKDGTPLDAYHVNKRDLIPEYDGKGPNTIYFVMPLYVESFVVGYFIMVKKDTSIRDWIFENYESCMIQSLTYYKTNIRLTALNDKLSELMQTDALTSLKNRTAFENAKNLLKNHVLAKDEIRFAAVMFDLNDLKKVNDELGHSAGDSYIKNSSVLICNTFKHSPVFRIGGDEFVAIVKNSDYEKRYELLDEFKKEIDRLSKEDISPMERISVACGMADYDEIDNDDIETLFKKADDRMYENKHLMKAGRK
ncbi:MAG: GGDEF domain-containing protein [Lachnospiraceae bacterium]|nr:GGDEF domain-containing protein [Lachnospiraceae bacterium]